MKKWLTLILTIGSAFCLFSLNFSSQSENQTQVSAHSFETTESQKTTKSPEWAENEKIPFANKQYKVKTSNNSGTTVTEFKTGANGEWKSEILQSPTPSEVGIITIWDTEKVSTYHPDGKILNISEGFVKNEKVIPHKIFSEAVKEKVKKKTQLQKNGPQYNVYTEARLVPVNKDPVKREKVIGDRENLLPKTTKAKIKYHLNKGKNQITKVETLDESQNLISTVEITESNSFTPGSSEFIFDKSKARHIK